MPVNFPTFRSLVIEKKKNQDGRITNGRENLRDVCNF